MGNTLLNGWNWKYNKRFEKLMNEVGIKIIKRTVKLPKLFQKIIKLLV